jgi:hypothetical protein
MEKAAQKGDHAKSSGAPCPAALPGANESGTGAGSWMRKGGVQEVGQRAVLIKNQGLWDFKTALPAN